MREEPDRNPDEATELSLRRRRPDPRPETASFASALVGLVLLPMLLAMGEVRAAGLRLAVIGDSLSAEYDDLPNIPGVDDPTAYAAVTVPGWESRCWVEVLGLLRTNVIDFGPWKPDLPGWDDLRFTGYKYDFAIPGFEASQYEDIVNSSFFSNPQHLLYRQTISNILGGEADACVVWIGGNEFRANYGALYEGGDPTTLIANLRHDIGEILNFVQSRSPTLRIVVVNLPDLGATPSKRTAHPDPAKRELVSQATMLANQAISELAAARGLPVADAFAVTRRLIAGERIGFGAVDLINDSDADNDPHYAFTREGLHPNTGLQIEIARLITATFNAHHGTAIPPITDAEALGLLGLDLLEPYLDWAKAHAFAAAGLDDDPDHDGLANLVEFVFDLNPNAPSPSPVRIAETADGFTASYQPTPTGLRLANLTPERSKDLVTWTEVAPPELSTATSGVVTVVLPAGDPAGYLRLRVAVRPVE